MESTQSCIKKIKESSIPKIINSSELNVEVNHLKVYDLKQKIKKLLVDSITLKGFNQVLKFQLKHFQLE